MCWLGGLPVGGDTGVPVWGRGEAAVPENFSEVSFRGWGHDSEADWSVVTSDSEVGSSAGPQLRSVDTAKESQQFFGPKCPSSPQRAV